MVHALQAIASHVFGRRAAGHANEGFKVRIFKAVSGLLATAIFCAGCGTDEEPGIAELESGDIATWAGTGTQGHDGDGRHRLQSWLNQPMELVFAHDETALIIDWNNHALRRVTSEQTLTNVIGQPLPGDWPCQAPGDAANCEVPLSATIPAASLALNHPMDALFDGESGSFFVAAWHNHKILHCTSATEAVAVVSGAQKPGGSGDGAASSAALLNFPVSLVRQSDGSLLLSDERNNRVRRITQGSAPTISTVAGALPGKGTDGDELAATLVNLSLTTADKLSGADNPPPGGALALDANGVLYIADTFHHCVRRVIPGADGLIGVGDPAEEILDTVAGTCGAPGYAGDDGPAQAAKLNRPFDLEIGPDSALYIADTANHRIRRVDLHVGSITTSAGTGEPGFSGDGGPARGAKLREPYGLAFNGDGDLFIVDTLNNRIRRVLR
jgi:hypothetical protein